MTATTQQRRALTAGNAVRTQVKDLRLELRDGTVSLADILTDPPAYLSNYAIIDVIDLVWARPGRNASRRVLGRRAMAAGINLLTPLGRASPASLHWAAEHAPPRKHQARVEA